MERYSSEPRTPRRAGRVMLAIGLLCAVAGLAIAWNGNRPAARRIELTAGFGGTTRALVAQALAAEIAARGIACEVVEGGTAREEIARVASGEIDFALVSGIWPIDHKSEVRQVAPLHVEALHLLVKQEIAASVGENLAGLRGRSVDLGPAGSETEGLASAALEFAEASDPTNGAAASRTLNLDIGRLEEILDGGDRAALPDAVFHLATVPSIVAWRLVREADYRLVALPFAEAFRLAAILSSGDGVAAPLEAVDRRLVSPASIPAYLYQTDPAVPVQDLPTIGARLMLVAHARVSDETVARVLEAALHSRVAHMLHPSLDRSVLARTPRRDLHRGTLAFLARNEPAITGEAVDDLNNSLGIFGALIGGGAFLAQGWRQRRRATRDAFIAGLLLRVAAIERRIVEIELAAALDPATLMAVQRELLELKSEALDHLTKGEIDDHSLLRSLLDPIDSARDHVGELLLHVRDHLADRPMAEQSAARAIWDEASARSSRDAAGEAG